MSNTKQNQKGVSLYLTIVILSVLTAALLTLISISVSQIKIIWTLGDSVIAFYAADTGIEQVLMDMENPSDISQTPLGDATYEVKVYDSTTLQCDADNYCIQSIGAYKDTKRAIEIKY